MRQLLPIAAASGMLPPMDVLLEIGVAYIFTLVGILWVSGKFRPIQLSKDAMLR